MYPLRMLVERELGFLCDEYGFILVGQRESEEYSECVFVSAEFGVSVQRDMRDSFLGVSLVIFKNHRMPFITSVDNVIAMERVYVLLGVGRPSERFEQLSTDTQIAMLREHAILLRRCISKVIDDATALFQRAREQT